jgi:hypothetical protein
MDNLPESTKRRVIWAFLLAISLVALSISVQSWVDGHIPIAVDWIGSEKSVDTLKMNSPVTFWIEVGFLATIGAVGTVISGVGLAKTVFGKKNE